MKFIHKLVRPFWRGPDYIIGPDDDPYMRRWYVTPKSRWGGIYLHQICRSDDERAMHDHPVWNLSIVLKGGYWEHIPGARVWRRPGAIVLRSPTAPHRIETRLVYVKSERTILPLKSWSLWIRGPTVREWGFHCPNGWVPWQIFTAPDSGGRLSGKGCS